MNRKRNGNALRMIGLAAMAGIGLHFNTADDTLAGGGGADKKTADDKKPEPKKIELTEAELNERVANAAKAEREKLSAERQREREEAEAEAARKRGEFEKLYNDEKADRAKVEAERESLRLELRKKDVSIKLQRHLSANHKDYVENDVDILPHVAVDADTPDDEVDKRIKDAAAAFVKRTPKASPLSGAPSTAARGKLDAGIKADRQDDQDKRVTRPVGPAARF